VNRLDNELPGPDFLASVAEAELHNGNEINAQAFRKRANEWQRDQRELAEAREKIEEMRDRLAHAQSALIHGPRIRGAAAGARQ
jgi:hypothetical protein